MKLIRTSFSASWFKIIKESQSLATKKIISCHSVATKSATRVCTRYPFDNRLDLRDIYNPRVLSKTYLNKQSRLADLDGSLERNTDKINDLRGARENVG